MLIFQYIAFQSFFFKGSVCIHVHGSVCFQEEIKIKLLNYFHWRQVWLHERVWPVLGFNAWLLPLWNSSFYLWTCVFCKSSPMGCAREQRAVPYCWVLLRLLHWHIAFNVLHEHRIVHGSTMHGTPWDWKQHQDRRFHLRLSKWGRWLSQEALLSLWTSTCSWHRKQTRVFWETQMTSNLAVSFLTPAVSSISQSLTLKTMTLRERGK